MKSINNQIEIKIKNSQRGKIIFAEDFKKFGSAEVIRITLFRLCKKGLIVRLSPGIYLYPKRDKDDNIVYPSIHDVIKQIAKRDKARIVPTGLYALNALGLSTQVPMRFMFLSDGAARTVKIGKVRVAFKKTAPKNLAYKSKVCSLVIFALKEIGKGKVNAEELAKIYDTLSHETAEKILHDALLAPHWISDILMNYLKIRNNE
ncbi:MAG: type IV toxin-antitoxin system AbiEi family antitoxin domain-containing protein [Dysgonamonadaceae bacterium]|jgi:predicted transcriptional regulator of viral defense system|nr:type IV toxin-antitoxin system AbiEi family antitoxin domain-containing protein [Dysgonamonadaceae bacterium]